MGETVLETLPQSNTSMANGVDRSPEVATAAFKQKIEESKVKMQLETQAPRRGPGRPRKIVASATAAPSAQTTSPSASLPTSAPPPDISTYLVAPLMAVSKIPAAKLAVPELSLSEEEAALCAKSCNELLNAFAPNIGLMSPKTAAIIGACSVFGSIGFSKYQIYLAKTAIPVNQSEKKEGSQPAPSQVFPTEIVGGAEGRGQTAQDFFNGARREAMVL